MARVANIDHPLRLRVILGQGMKHCIYQAIGGWVVDEKGSIWMLA